MTDVFISVGSNIEPQKNIVAALRELNGYQPIVAISNFYSNVAIRDTQQPDFINGVVEIRTATEPLLLKYDLLRRIEDLLGRVRGENEYLPRTIDLDLILYGNLVINSPQLRIPDPNIRIYPFIAVPLSELEPGLILPDSLKPLLDEPIIKRKDVLHLETEFSEYLRQIINS